MRSAFLRIAKLCVYGLFFNWYVFSILRGSLIPRLSILLYAIAAGCFVMDLLFSRKERYIPEKEEWLWLVYAVVSYLTAVFAVDPGVAVNSLGDYLKRLFLTALVCYICKRERSIGFPIRLMTLVAVCCALAAITHLGGLRSRLDLTTGAQLSVNDVGSIMVYGIGTVLLFFERQRKTYGSTVVKIAAYVLLIVLMFIAGSRKTLYATAILLVSLLLLSRKRIPRKPSVTAVLVYTVIGIAVVAFVAIKLLPQMESTSLYDRIWGSRAEASQGSDESRIQLYVLALQDFVKHPIFGLGFNNYAVLHGNYTHSTYMDPLACSGILGLLYLLPYGMILIKQIRIIRTDDISVAEREYQKKMLALYFAFLFIGIGIPYVYKDAPCVILAMFIASQSMANERYDRNKGEIEQDGEPTVAGIADHHGF